MRFTFVTLALFGTLAVGFPGLAKALEEVEHPIYKSWARHPVGTTTTLKSVTVQQGQMMRLTIRRMFPLFPGVKKEDIGKLDGSISKGVEPLKVGGKEYKADWFDSKSRVEAGDAFTRTWMHDDIPGKLLKAATKVPAGDKVTTLELTEIKKP